MRTKSTGVQITLVILAATVMALIGMGLHALGYNLAGLL